LCRIGCAARRGNWPSSSGSGGRRSGGGHPRSNGGGTGGTNGGGRARMAAPNGGGGTNGGGNQRRQQLRRTRRSHAGDGAPSPCAGRGGSWDSTYTTRRRGEICAADRALPRRARQDTSTTHPRARPPICRPGVSSGACGGRPHSHVGNVSGRRGARRPTQRRRQPRISKGTAYRSAAGIAGGGVGYISARGRPGPGRPCHRKPDGKKANFASCSRGRRSRRTRAGRDLAGGRVRPGTSARTSISAPARRRRAVSRRWSLRTDGGVGLPVAGAGESSIGDGTTATWAVAARGRRIPAGSTSTLRRPPRAAATTSPRMGFRRHQARRRLGFDGGIGDLDCDGFGEGPHRGGDYSALSGPARHIYRGGPDPASPTSV